MSNTIKRLLLGALTIVALSAGVAIAVGAAGGDGTPSGTTTDGTTITSETTTTTTTTTGDDISGPCDEAEHANDPRCSGSGPAGGRIDNSGPGSANSGHGSWDDDDRWDDD